MHCPDKHLQNYIMKVTNLYFTLDFGYVTLLFFFMFANVHWMNGHILCIFIVSRMDNAIVFVKLIFGALGGDCFNCTRGIQCHMYAPSNLHWKMCSLIGIKTMAVNGLHLQFEKGYLFIWKFELTRKRIWNVSSFVGTKMCREKMNVLLK